MMDEIDPRDERALPVLLGGRPLAVAESCTGGALAARIVGVSGSSRYFRGGVVAYANDIKQRLLGVPEAVLVAYGAVSPECAGAMARGARTLLGAELALATTGIAGPDGGTPEKPVGLVYVALATPEGETVTRNVWTGGRSENIELSVREGLRLLRAYIERGDG